MKTKVPFNTFKQAFPSRELSLRYRLTKIIWLVEDYDNGSLHIEEHPSAIGYLLFLIVVIFAVPVQFISQGLYGVLDLWEEVLSIYWKRIPLRKDDLKWNQDSTIKLLTLMRLHGYGETNA